MFAIIFEYDGIGWEVYASGASSELEARQGFNAVLLTAREATPELEYNRAELQPDGRFKIIVELVPMNVEN